MVVEQLVSLLIACILRHGLHEGRIAHLVRTWLTTQSGMLQIEAIASTPLPRVIEIEHSDHLALAHLHEQVVETSENGVVIDARLDLQRGFHLGLEASLAISTHEDAQVIDAHTLHLVELTS